MKSTKLTGLLLLIAATTACDDGLGPIDSVPMTLTINSMNSSDIEPSGLIQKDENISTETGNPWGEFVRAAEDRCVTPPVGFEVQAVSLGLDVPGSSDVRTLDEVITGEATVFFASTRGSDEDALRVDVASATSVQGTGPVPLAVTATRAQLDVLFERLLGGDFHVGLRAETDRRRDESFSMDARITVQARALCR